MNPPVLLRRANFFATLALCLITSLSAKAAGASPTDEDPLKPEVTASNDRIFENPEFGTTKVALKTNLLFWMVGGANVGLEFPIGQNFSVTATTAFTRITINDTYAIQTLQGGLDAKYWFNPRKRPLTGWSIGIYGVYGGHYDVQWKKGWQGDSFVSAGLSGGYSLPIGRSLNLEFLLAAGWFYTPQARQIIEVDGGRLMWGETRSNVNRFSLTKAQVNLVWLIGKRNK